MSALKTVLMIAFHFPPVVGSSGVQRTLRFCHYLPRYGWRPIVLSIARRAYEVTGSSAGNEIPDGLEVYRAFGLDTARHLSIAGRYPHALAIPDRWATWRHFAIPLALKLIRRYSPAVVWSTFPVASAHSIGLAVRHRSGLPWIAEFRDPMWQGENYPAHPAVNAAWLHLEREVTASADRVVVVTRGAAEIYRSRYPARLAERLDVIENGYDEASFIRLETNRPVLNGQSRSSRRSLRIVHSGIVYRGERDPSSLFHAIAAMKRGGVLTSERLEFVLRATGDDVGYRRDTERLGISDIVKIEPAIGYLEALDEMRTADGLCVLQGKDCNAQVPAKLYEYLRSGRPIIAFTDPSSDTAETLRRASTGVIAPLDSQEAIEKSLVAFVAAIESGTWSRPDSVVVAGLSRERQTAQFAAILDRAVMAC